MKWIAEPDLPNLSPRTFYARINTLNTWLDYADALNNDPAFRREVLFGAQDRALAREYRIYQPMMLHRGLTGVSN